MLVFNIENIIFRSFSKNVTYIIPSSPLYATIYNIILLNILLYSSFETKLIQVTLIKSISGIRGTIGGKPGTNLTPVDIVECTAGFGRPFWLCSRHTLGTNFQCRNETQCHRFSLHRCSFILTYG